MAHRTAIISGASIAGLSTAYWLRRTGWDVTVIERAAEFRDGGQNVDIRGVARDVLRRMDLFDAVKARNTTETGAVLVDERGVVTVELPSDGAGGATAELEILRGDLARTILDHLPPGVSFVYGDTVSTVNDDAEGVTVTTEKGQLLSADLFVIAEGVRSRTRPRSSTKTTSTSETSTSPWSSEPSHEPTAMTTVGGGTTPFADARFTFDPTRMAPSARSSPTLPAMTSSV